MIAFLLTFMSAVTAFADTNSVRYNWLETDSPQRSQFIQAHSSAVLSREQADPNYANIEYWLFQLYDFPQQMKRTDIDSTHSVLLIDRGIGKPTELVLDSPDGQTVLVSNDQALTDSQQNIISFGLSPDKKSVFVVVQKDGSIDGMQVSLYDVMSGKPIGKPLVTAENSIAWTSSSTLVYASIDSKLQRFLSQYDLKTQETQSIPRGALITDGIRYVILYNGKTYLLHDKLDASETSFHCVSPTQIVSEDAQGAAVWCQGQDGMGEVRSFVKGGSNDQIGTPLIVSSDKPIRAASRQGQFIFVTVRNGADRWVRIYGIQGGPQLWEIPVPECCSMNLSWAVPGKTLSATMTSALGVFPGFNYDLASGQWNHDPAATALTLNSVSYQSDVVFATSNDGTQVPVRLTHRSDLAADGSHPVYFRSYGGFGDAGFLDPTSYREPVEFLKRGGILADPGLRGGNEFGPSWHQQAMLQNKMNTYYDLHAAAQLVVQQGWTTPQKIISTGTSNGGLTVAATALLFPDSFGLVIPIAGVNDLLGKEHLDAADQGWDGEFGSALDPQLFPFLTSISPLENAKSLGAQHFLIIDGIDDTRVNPAHSFKLAAALQDQGGSAGIVELASFQDAGHWLTDVYYQNSIAWHANVLLWTEIFAQAGWKW